MTDVLKVLEVESDDFDLSLKSLSDDELWLEHYLEYFELLLDDCHEMLKDFGLEDLLGSCPITVTYDLSNDVDAVFDLFEDRIYINYLRKPSLGMLLNALGDRFFYGLEDVDQEQWLIESHERTGNHNPRALFSQMFVAHFCEDKDLEEEIYDLFYEVSDLELVEDD